MPNTINTAKVADRRKLLFTSLDDILADVEGLAKCQELRTLGNWSAGQNLKHLAIVMDKSIDGFGFRPSAFLRFFVRLMPRSLFLRLRMPPGFKLPPQGEAELGPPPTTLADGIESIRRAIGRLKTETTRAPHPVLRVLSNDQWNQLHCRHSELHLSFVVPVE